MAEPTKVLIAACKPTVRRAARRAAEDAGLAVVAEWTQEHTAGQIGGGHGADVVLADRAFVEESRWSRPEDEKAGVPVIVIATSGRTDWFVEAGRRGATDFLAMPFRTEHLKEKVDRALSSGALRLREVYGTTNLQELWAAAQPQRDVLGQDEIDALLSATEPEIDTVSEADDALAAAMREEMAADAEKGGVDGDEVEDLLTRAMHRTLSGEKLFRQGANPVPTEASECRITGYDFKHPARINKDQLRTLESLHDQFARLLSSTLSGTMRAVVDVDTAFVDQTTYREFIMSLSNPSLSYQFSLAGAGQAIIDIAMPVVFGIIDRAMGGAGSGKGVDARQVTPIEIQQMNQVARRVIRDLEDTWRPIRECPISDVELETNPEFMQITAPSEIVILLAFEVNATNMSGLISLCYPFFTLEPLVHLLGRRSPDGQPRHSRAERQRANRLRLGDVDLDLVAELGRARIRAGEAAELAAGDVICLQTRTRDPARVFIGGQPTFLAWPCEDEGDVKLQIAGRIPPHLAGKYGSAPRE